jgi:uncharacterized membrane protein
MSSFMNTPDATSSYSQSDIEQNKVMAVLAYLGFLVLVPILAAKESPYARFHASQGLNLFVSEVAFGIINVILTLIFSFIPLLNVVWLIIAWLIGIAFFVLMILGIVNAVQGKAKQLPIVGSFRILK